MAYRSVDRVPNWEAGAWPQTVRRWRAESAEARELPADWFPGCPALGLDRRQFIPFNGQAVPPFAREVLEEDEHTQVVRDELGRVRRALKDGAVGEARVSMDTYLRFAVQDMDDWRRVKRRFTPGDPRRYSGGGAPANGDGTTDADPVIFGPNTQTKGFYWIARDLLGTEGLSYAWYDQPQLMEDMMTFWGDFLIESMRPVLQARSVDYICLAEDLAMRSGPLLGPDTYRRFIYPHLQRVIGFAKTHGVRYVCIDTDGNPEPLIPMMLDAGVDALWPLERTADQDPARLRQTFGRSLRLWGGVDKRALAQSPAAIDAHLRTLRPLIEDGGYIPTVDHTVPPDVSWSNFQHYLKQKDRLLNGEFG